MTQSVVTGQQVSVNSNEFAFLVQGLVGQQVGNIPTAVLENWFRRGGTDEGGYNLTSQNRLLSSDGQVRIATAFAILDKDGRVLLVNRAGQSQEIINKGVDLSHAGATLHPISIHYKMSLMDPRVFALLGAKIISIEYTEFEAVEQIKNSAESSCRMPVFVIRTDFDSKGIPGFYFPDEISKSTQVTAKTAAALQYLLSK